MFDLPVPTFPSMFIFMRDEQCLTSTSNMMLDRKEKKKKRMFRGFT